MYAPSEVGLGEVGEGVEEVKEEKSPIVVMWGVDWRRRLELRLR